MTMASRDDSSSDKVPAYTGNNNIDPLGNPKIVHQTEHNGNMDAPVLPRDRNILELLKDEKKLETLHSSGSLKVFMVMAEDKVFLQGFNKLQWAQKHPAMLRGDIIVKIIKPVKLKSISLKFDGQVMTEWPEGIPSTENETEIKNTGEYAEVNDIVQHTWPFYKNDTVSPGVANHHSMNSSSFLKESSSCNIYYPLSVINAKNTNELAAVLSNASSFEDDNINHQHQVQQQQQQQQQQSLRSLSPFGGLLGGFTNRRRSSTVTSLDSLGISDLLSVKSNNSTLNEPPSIISTNNNVSSTNGTGTHFVFQPGYYVYSFEQCIPLSHPETIKSLFGNVSYFLHLSVERVGAFKSNIYAKREIQLIRTQSDSSVEETEPISIVRDWENVLNYDILIASKDIVLNAFLPISFCLTPIEKVNLHRIRVYLTETMEYYAKGKKVHRVEPAKKYLLAEYKAPPLKDLAPELPKNKAKYLGNILSDNPADPKNGFLSYKEIDLQVYVPEFVANNTRIHPDTVCTQIKSNHWIKIGLRLSRYVDDKLKHFEISIDSPIHVLDKYCTHGNTLLPSYESHLFFADSSQNLGLGPSFDDSYNIYHDLPLSAEDELDESTQKDAVTGLITNSGNSTDNARNTTHTIHMGYHTSNFYFPKEVMNSPIMSPNVEALNVSHANHNTFFHTQHNHTSDQTHDSTLNAPAIQFAGNTKMARSQTVGSQQAPHFIGKTSGASLKMKRSMSAENNSFVQSSEMQSNLYSPDRLKPEFMSPQAFPLGSPLSSPVLGPIQVRHRAPSMSILGSPTGSFLSLNEDLIKDDIPPPPFEERQSKKSLESNEILATHRPPSYTDVLKHDGIVTASTARLSQNNAKPGVPSLKFTVDGDLHDNLIVANQQKGNSINNLFALSPHVSESRNSDLIRTSENTSKGQNDSVEDGEEDFGSGFEFKSLLPSPDQQIGYKDIGTLLMKDDEESEDPISPGKENTCSDHWSKNHQSENYHSNETRRSRRKQDYGDDLSDIAVSKSRSLTPVRSLVHNMNNSCDAVLLLAEDSNVISAKLSNNSDITGFHDQDHIRNNEKVSSEDDCDEEDMCVNFVPSRISADVEFRTPLLNEISRHTTNAISNDPFYNIFADSKESVLFSDNLKPQDTELNLRKLSHRVDFPATNMAGEQAQN